MSTQDRRQRERAEREARILELSRSMLLEGGYHTLNMERIADELDYAKGTIYNHFRNKEEIIIALAIQTQQKRLDTFQQAAQYQGRSRERLLAVGVAAEYFVQHFPEHFKVEQILRSASIWEKTSEKRQAVMRQCERNCMTIVGDLVRAAVQAGDLVLPEGVSPEDLVFGLWALNFGAHTIIATSDPLAEIGIADPIGTIDLNISKMLDGYGWRPLSTEHDYPAVAQQIAAELFPETQEAAAV